MTRLTSPTWVITRSDIPPGFRAVTLDNSVFARFNDDIESLKAHRLSVPLRRILALMADNALLQSAKLQFVVSQAIYYDRIGDEHPIAAAVRLMVPSMIAHYAPEHRNVIMEWPVARVDSMLSRLPLPRRTRIVSQDGQTFQRRMTSIKKHVGTDEEARAIFRRNPVLQVPLCVYEPGEAEDRAAHAFRYSSFCAVPDKRIVDVCHVASHLRFASAGGILVADDRHFNQARLAAIGVKCMSPEEFVAQIDPNGDIAPAEMC